jgi:hypothetical protein
MEDERVGKGERYGYGQGSGRQASDISDAAGEAELPEVRR